MCALIFLMNVRLNHSMKNYRNDLRAKMTYSYREDLLGVLVGL